MNFRDDLTSDDKKLNEDEKLNEDAKSKAFREAKKQIRGLEQFVSGKALDEMYDISDKLSELQRA